ncbi:MAG: FKBP-type peptidyl-prolyl cis-trans isomerase [Bacteroidetes bacterium]|nr:FKBP-type peptidyl-prolyl cis-trans isomerase [Bacteroidota bacterium]
MKNCISCGLLFSLLMVYTVHAQKSTVPKTDKEKVSYIIGQNIAKDFKSKQIDIDLQMLLKGIEDELGGKKGVLTEKEIEETMQKFQKEMVAKIEKKQKEENVKNRKEGETFAAEYKKKAGVTTLPNGLQYRVLKEGKGPKPTAEQTVKVHYRGTFIDGKEFDSSYKRGQPVEFPLNGVIRGWSEALQLMPVGSKWEIVIPPDLAYGENGAGSVIPPGATLVFEVELLEIK